MRARKHFYVDADRLTALEEIARAEHMSVSDLVREGIERVISDRRRHAAAPTDHAVIRGFSAFIDKWRGTGPELSDAEIEEVISREMRPNE